MVSSQPSPSVSLGDLGNAMPSAVARKDAEVVLEDARVGVVMTTYVAAAVGGEDPALAAVTRRRRCSAPAWKSPTTLARSVEVANLCTGSARRRRSFARWLVMKGVTPSAGVGEDAQVRADRDRFIRVPAQRLGPPGLSLRRARRPRRRRCRSPQSAEGREAAGDRSHQRIALSTHWPGHRAVDQRHQRAASTGPSGPRSIVDSPPSAARSTHAGEQALVVLLAGEPPVAR